MESTDGYAKATSEAYDRRAAELYSEQARDVDIIITTALIPGRAAPRLITAEDVAAMKPGSVIVDMAAGQGGNVDGSVAGERVVTDNGVVILGYTDLAGRLPTQASQLYGTNLVNLVKLLTPGKDGAARPRLRRRRAALHHGRPGRRIDLAATTGAGVGGAGRGIRRCRGIRSRRRRSGPLSPARRSGLVVAGHRRAVRGVRRSRPRRCRSTSSC